MKFFIKDLDTFTGEILNVKFLYFCSVLFLRLFEVAILFKLLYLLIFRSKNYPKNGLNFFSDYFQSLIKFHIPGCVKLCQNTFVKPQLVKYLALCCVISCSYFKKNKIQKWHKNILINSTKTQLFLSLSL